jgi:hypothetical protein
MKQASDKPADAGSPFELFKELAGRLIRVPKKEIDRQQAADQRKKAVKKKKRS